MKDRVVVVDLYPSLLQPEGDRGNPLVLAHRARRYGVDVELRTVHPGQPVPDADLVCLGGSEDADLPVAARLLRESGALLRLTDGGAVVLGVGAGYALLARELVAVDGTRHPATGVLDVTMRDSGSLVAGPVLAAPQPGLGLGAVSGYEHHRQVGERGPDAEPWLPLEVGRGDSGDAGSRRGRVVGTWMHGPVLPRNPDLADLLLRWSGIAVDPSGCPEDGIAQRVRARRAAEARQASNM